MPSQLENIKKLKARQYTWKLGGEVDDGFIAQEFYSVYPNKNPIKDSDKYADKLYPKNEDGSDYLFGLDYGRMTPMLWKGVSELIDIVQQQQQTINSQQQTINSQQQQIDELKQTLALLLQKYPL